jgi:hypothetical protein
LVIGAFVRGLSMRDVEDLCEKAGLGKRQATLTRRVGSGDRARSRGLVSIGCDALRRRVGSKRALPGRHVSER